MKLQSVTRVVWLKYVTLMMKSQLRYRELLFRISIIILDKDILNEIWIFSTVYWFNLLTSPTDILKFWKQSNPSLRTGLRLEEKADQLHPRTPIWPTERDSPQVVDQIHHPWRCHHQPLDHWLLGENPTASQDRGGGAEGTNRFERAHCLAWLV